MATGEIPALPLGVYAPLAVNNHEDRGGLIIVISAFALGVALVFLAIRGYIQQIRRTVWLDDVLLLVATVFFCLQTSSVFVQVHHGWGKMNELLRMHNYDAMLKAAYITDMLYIMTLYISKCSASLFYLRISPGRKLNFAVWSIFSIVTIWMVASVLVLGLRCDARQPWTDITAKCDKIFPRWQAICIADAITELAIACLSIILVHDIQISNRRKSQVVLALSCRIIVFAPAGLHLFYLHRQVDSSNPTYHATYATICAQIQVGYILVANTIPCLKPFIAAYEGLDAKLTFRGQSTSPGESGVLMQYESSPENRRSDSKENDEEIQVCPSEKPNNLQQRRKGIEPPLTSLLLPRPDLGIRMLNSASIQRTESVIIVPFLSTTCDGYGHGRQLSPVIEVPESEQCSPKNSHSQRDFG